MSSTIISIDGFELVGNISVNVTATKDNNKLESKSFTGDSYEEIKEKIKPYVQQLRVTYHPTIVRNNLPKTGTVMFKKLLKLANGLDHRGLYDEANLVDKIIRRYAEEYQDYDPGHSEPPEEWEAAMMEMDMSPEVLKKEREYKKREMPTDPEDIEELIMRTKMLLKGVDYPDVEGPSYWSPQEESKDVGEKWYFGTEGLPEEDEWYPEDMADDPMSPEEIQSRLMEPNKPRGEAEQKAFEDWIAGRTFAPSKPLTKEELDEWENRKGK